MGEIIVDGDTGSLNIRRYIHDIRSMDFDDIRTSSQFSLCGITFELLVERNNDNLVGVYLSRIEDDYEDLYSCEVTMSIELLSTNSSRNKLYVLQGRSPRSRYIFGVRKGETMSRGCDDLIAWCDLLNPQLGYIESGEDDIQLKLNMAIVNIYEH